MRIIITILLLWSCTAAYSQELWQLSPWAADSNYVIGALPSGEPTWVHKDSIGRLTIDSTVVLNSYGTIITESPANTWNVKVDSSKYATVYDLTQVSVADSTVVSAGSGISVVESPANTFTITNTRGSMDSLYNGNRAISRVPTVGTNLAATTFRQWLDWWYIANYQQPTISLGSLATPVEVGTSTSYTLAGSTTNPCSFTLSSGTVNGNSFGSATSYSYSYTHAPTSAGTTTITASQNWSQTGTTCATGSPTSGTTSASRSINNVYPVLYGMSASDFSGGGITYADWTVSGSPNDQFKRVVTEGNQSSMAMTGTNEYIYIIIPKSWSDWTVSSIVDHNGFNVTSSFTGYDVTITSTGLVNNWTQNYRLYKLNSLTTASGFNYVYNR